LPLIINSPLTTIDIATDAVSNNKIRPHCILAVNLLMQEVKSGSKNKHTPITYEYTAADISIMDSFVNIDLNYYTH
jgi:hypothetical protein